MKPLLHALLFGLFLSTVTATPVELRDKDVLYFDQYLPDKITLKLEKMASIFLDKDFQTLAANLPAGTTVQIVGIGNDGNYLVGVNHRGTNIEGWMATGDLPPIDPQLIERAKQNQAQRNAIQQAIKEKRVVIGMTLEDVKKSLGKPERTAFRQDAQVRFDTWTYITYELIPQNTYVTDAFGRTTLQTIYVKSPTGELSVEFNNGTVVSVEEHRRAPRTTTGVTVPTAPVTTKK